MMRTQLTNKNFALGARLNFLLMNYKLNIKAEEEKPPPPPPPPPPPERRDKPQPNIKRIPDKDTIPPPPPPDRK